MLKNIVISVHILLAVASGYTLLKPRSTEKENIIYIKLLSGFAMGGALLQALYFTANTYGFSLVINELYCICIDWFLYALFRYIRHFTKVYTIKAWFNVLITILCIFDSIMLILNTFSYSVFSIQTDVFFDIPTYSITNFTALFYFHTALCSVLSISSIISLFIRTRRETSRLYKTKFSHILIIFVIEVIVNATATFTHSPIDISTVIYTVLVNVIAYYSTGLVEDSLKNKTLSLVMSEMKDFIIVCDNDKNIVYINPITTRMIEVEEVNRIVTDSFNTLKIIDDKYPDDYSWNNYVVIDDTLKNCTCRYQKLKNNNELSGHMFVISDRTTEIEDYKQERHQRTHDPLTDLYRKEYFYECARNRLAQNPDTSYYLVCSDIYGFKMYNALFGDKMGDQVLICEANFLKACNPKRSVYGRLDSDEFAILIREDDFDENLFVDRILWMRKNFGSDQYRIYVNAGIYKITDHEEPISSMCDKAKMALDKIRDDYNTVIAYYDKELTEQSLLERWLLDQLDGALKNSQFKMYLQPQVDARTEKWVGAEALVRWIHPERGIISPGDFIPVFEKYGCIPKIDIFMWEEAAKKLREWADRGLNDLYISVNISGADFYHFDPCQVLKDLTKKYKIDPSKLKLEITETVLMKSARSHKDILSDFSKNGFTVEIDDFGSGYSSLNTLREIDVDVIKLDMGFLKNTDEAGKSTAILSNVVKMIKDLKLETIAEGVELKSQAEELANLGCDKFQGFYYSKPIPVYEFEEKLEKNL